MIFNYCTNWYFLHEKSSELVYLQPYILLSRRSLQNLKSISAYLCDVFDPACIANECRWMKISKQTGDTALDELDGRHCHVVLSFRSHASSCIIAHLGCYQEVWHTMVARSTKRGFCRINEPPTISRTMNTHTLPRAHCTCSTGKYRLKRNDEFDCARMLV